MNITDSFECNEAGEYDGENKDYCFEDENKSARFIPQEIEG